MEKTLFITITGTNHYYGMKPFEIHRVIRLVKEPDNEYDAEAIRAELPYIDKIGYVANTHQTVAKGTISAGRLYDQIGNYAYAQVFFATSTKVICLVLSPEEVEKEERADHEKEENKEEPEQEVRSDSKTSPQGIRSRIIKARMKIGFRV